jgi:PleD family two-component response regulator
MENVRRLLDLNNQFYVGKPVSLSMGFATRTPGERIEDVARRADVAMYEAKRRHYAGEDADRSVSPPPRLQA